jgi:hypothetical protein
MMHVVTRPAMIARLNSGEQIIIHKDASPYLVGSVTFLKGKPTTAYNQKLTAETCCTTTGHKLLSIVITLKAHHDILLCYKIKIYTDRQNLVHDYFDTKHVARWHLILQESGITLTYIR